MSTQLAIIRAKITLQDLIILPVIPLVVDTLCRVFLLYDRLEWFLIPDYVVTLVTLAFFNIGLMNAVKPSQLPADDETNANIDLVRRQLLTIGIFAIMFAGGVSIYRALDEAYPDKFIAHTHSIFLFIFVMTFILYNMYEIYFKYIYYAGG